MSYTIAGNSWYVIRERKSDNYVLKTGGIHHDFADSDAQFETYDQARDHWSYDPATCDIIFVEAKYELTVDKRI